MRNSFQFVYSEFLSFFAEIWQQCCPILWQKRRWIQDKASKSKSISHFPDFDASSAWQMGHNLRQGFYPGQELLLHFSAWIDLTSNADNSLILVEFEVIVNNWFML